MRVVLLLLTLTGGAFGGVMYWLADAQDSEFAVVRDIGAGGVARLDVSKRADRSKAAASSTTPSATEAVATHTANVEIERPEHRFFGAGLTGTPAARTGESATTVVAPAKSEPWQTDVVLVPRHEPSAGNSAIVMTTAGLPAPREMSRDALVRDLQRELRRVGCYSGDVNGEWNAGSKRALQGFLDRSNSALPTSVPDLIQLTLVRGYSGVACRPGDPSSITARAPTSRGEQIHATQGQNQQVQSQPFPPVAVRALPQQQPPQQQSVAKAVPPSAVASLPQAQPAPVPPQSADATGQPPVVIFEGRMAIGGPRTPEGPDTSTSPPITSSAPVVPPPGRIGRPKGSGSTGQRPRRERNWTANFFNQ